MASDFKPCVVIISGADLGKRFELSGTSTFGRHSTCEVQIGSDDVVSRFHMEIEASVDGWLIRDLGSRNGTFVDDERISGDQLLADSAKIRVGKTLMKFFSTSVAADRVLIGINEKDGLTGVWNKRSVLSQIGEAFDQGKTVSLAMFDLVDFKDLNDQNGFAIGDAVLRDVGQFLMDSAGATAQVGRIGGEEFVLWITGKEDDVQELAASIVDQMYDLKFGAPEEESAKLWVGTAQSEPEQKPIELIAEAERRLDDHRTKTRGAWNTSENMSHFVLVSNHPCGLFELPFGEPRVGRSEHSHIRLKSPRIAKSHARLIVTRTGVEIVDHNTTNGVFVNGERMRSRDISAISQVPLELGDVFHIGEFSFELALAPWLVVEPPADLIVAPASGAQQVWQDRHLPTGFNDELWAAYYLRWRKLIVETLCDGQAVSEDECLWPIRAAGKMCSPPMIQWIRDLLIHEDNRFWFLGYRNHFINALVNAEHGIGPLSAHKIMRDHPDDAARRHALEGLLGLASQDGHTQVATAVFDRVPPESTSIAALISPIFQHARQGQESWGVDAFMDYLSRPSFAEAAEGIVFAVWSPSKELVETFRPSEGSLLTLDDEVLLEPGHHVCVAEAQHLTLEQTQRWEAHLASFEIVQPFEQFGE